MYKITHINSSAGIGGGETHLLLLARYLHGNGFHLDFVLPEEGTFCDRLHAAGLTYQVVPMTSKFQPNARRRLRQLLERNAPDLVHCHGARANWFGRTAARQAGVRTVFSTVHNSLKDYPYPGWLRRLYVMMEKRTAFLVSQWIAVSQSIKSDLVEYYGLPPGRIDVIPNGVDLRDFQPAARRSDVLRELSLPAEVNLLIAAGRMTEQKGHRYLLAAIARIYSDFPDLHCLLAGDGPLRGTLENEARRLGIRERVHFVGFRSDVPDLVAAADLYVLSSISEGMPIGLLEAMALRCPVVASAVNGVTEVVRHRIDGLLVPPSDPDSLSQAIRELLTDLSLRRRLAEAGRERVAQDFTAEKMAFRVADLYRARLAETRLTPSAPGI